MLIFKTDFKSDFNFYIFCNVFYWYFYWFCGLARGSLKVGTSALVCPDHYGTAPGSKSINNLSSRHERWYLNVCVVPPLGLPPMAPPSPDGVSWDMPWLPAGTGTGVLYCQASAASQPSTKAIQPAFHYSDAWIINFLVECLSMLWGMSDISIVLHSSALFQMQ